MYKQKKIIIWNNYLKKMMKVHTSFRVLNNNNNDNDENHNYWMRNSMFDIFNDKECYDFPSSNPINNASNDE